MPADRLAEILKPHVETKGENFLRYGPMSAKLNSALIVQSAELWRALRSECPGLLFKQSTVEAALGLVCDELCLKLDIKGKATSLRSQARAINQSTAKNPGAPWLAKLWGSTVSSKPEAGKGSTDPSLSDEQCDQQGVGDQQGDKPEDDDDDLERGGEGPGWFFGYSREVNKAWRASATHPERREYASEIRIPPGATDGDCVEATFEKDGSWHKIEQMTTEEYRTLVQVQKKTARGALWASDDGVYKILRKEDRNPLLALNENGKQILQVKLAYWSSDDNLKAALACLTQCAKDLCDGTVSKDGLKAHRDEVVKQHGGDMKALFKRPAECDSAETPAKRASPPPGAPQESNPPMAPAASAASQPAVRSAAPGVSQPVASWHAEMEQAPPVWGMEELEECGSDDFEIFF